MCEIIQTQKANNTEWQDYLTKMVVNHYAYDWRWSEILKKSFKHEPYFLMAKDSSGIRGVLPLFFVNSLLFGRALISIPYLNGGGALADTPEIESQLYQAAIEQSKVLKTKYLEIRKRETLSDPIIKDRDLKERSHKVAMVLRLENDPETMFANFPPKLRSQIRRPAKEGCMAESFKGQDITECHIRDFYAVFADTMRSLGTPVYPIRLFRDTIRSFGDRARIITVRHQNAPIASGITIRTGTHVEIPWASALRKHSKYAPNMLLYWETIRQSSLDGCEFFDFGRSSVNSGTFKFKSQWGAQPLPLHWYYHTDGSDIPDVNPDDKKFSLAIKAWRRLPLPITKILGNYLTRSLP